MYQQNGSSLQPNTGLPIVAGLAERLPVGLIPEQPLIAAVRKDVVNYGGGRQAIRPQALRAERVFF